MRSSGSIPESARSDRPLYHPCLPCWPMLQYAKAGPRPTSLASLTTVPSAWLPSPSVPPLRTGGGACPATPPNGRRHRPSLACIPSPWQCATRRRGCTTRPIMLAPPSATGPLAPRRPLVISPTQITWCMNQISSGHHNAPLDLRGLIRRRIGGSVLV